MSNKSYGFLEKFDFIKHSFYIKKLRNYNKYIILTYKYINTDTINCYIKITHIKHLWSHNQQLSSVFTPNKKCTEGETTHVNLYPSHVMMPQQQQQFKQQSQQQIKNKNPKMKMYQQNSENYHDYG